MVILWRRWNRWIAKSASTLIFLIICVVHINAHSKSISVRENPNYDGRALTIPISADAGIDLYSHWMEQAYSGLFAAIAKQRLSKRPKAVQEQLTECSKRAKTVILHARCLMELLREDAQDGIRTIPVSPLSSNNINSDRLVRLQRPGGNWVGDLRIDPMRSEKGRFFKETLHPKRAKRGSSTTTSTVVRRENYGLLGRNVGLGALGTVAKLLTKTLSSAKKKDRPAEWQNTVDKIRFIMKRRKEEQKKKNEEEMEKSIESSDTARLNGVKRTDIDNLDEVINSPTRLKKMLGDKRKEKAQDGVEKLTTLVRQGVKLGFMLAGENTTDFDEKTMKLISPRFLSLIPEEDNKDNDTISLLSPSLFSMHNEGQGLEKLASLPNLAKEFNGEDQQQWMNFILEAAGVEEELEKFEKIEMDEKKWEKAREKYDEEIRGEDGQPLYFTKQNVTDRFGDYEKRKVDTWEKLVGNYSKEQWKELNETGYSTLSKGQLHMLYGPQSPYNDTETLAALANFTTDQIEKGIHRDIERTSELTSFKVRGKRDITLSPIVLSPIVLAAPILSQSVILSPLVLSPIVLTPAVLGPIILSPWVFVPLILSPRVLSPLIVNPIIFSPIVLSPFVLHPLILVPGVFNPFVLSPQVLSPFILSPQVFTPVVLSPLVLNPLILNPMVGSPLVLSPFVLSPIILSPQALFAVVLSPYALSPLIESKLIASALILSPSWLS